MPAAVPSGLREATGLLVFIVVPLAFNSVNSISRFIKFAIGSALTFNLERLFKVILKRSSSALGPIKPLTEKVELVI